MTEEINPRCDICREPFPDHELTGTKIGIWFVICCEPCRKENEKVKDITQSDCVIEIIDPGRSTSEVIPGTDHPQDRQGLLF